MDDITKLAKQMIDSMSNLNSVLNSLPPDKRKDLAQIQKDVNYNLDQLKKTIKNAEPNTKR